MVYRYQYCMELLSFSLVGFVGLMASGLGSVLLVFTLQYMQDVHIFCDFFQDTNIDFSKFIYIFDISSQPAHMK